MPSTRATRSPRTDECLLHMSHFRTIEQADICADVIGATPHLAGCRQITRAGMTRCRWPLIRKPR